MLSTLTPLGDPITTPAPQSATVAPVAWMPWPDHGPPASTAGEADFVRALTAMAGPDSDEHRRADVTAVLNALRAGITPERLLELAPGLRPRQLRGGYMALEQRRAESVAAWFAITDDPTVETFVRHAAMAERLLPVPVEYLRVKSKIDQRAFHAAVARADNGVRTAGSVVVRIEAELDRCERTTDWAVALGRKLYDPFEECALGHDYFLPNRVGALVPGRVAQLLAERGAPASSSIEQP